jgi:hypothetical protein
LLTRPSFSQTQSEKDRQAMWEQNQDTRWIIEACNDIIWLDNDMDSDVVAASRSRVLEHIAACGNVYKPQEMANFRGKVEPLLLALDKQATRLQELQDQLSVAAAQVAFEMGRQADGDKDAAAAVARSSKEEQRLRARLRTLEKENQQLESRAMDAMEAYAASEEARKPQKFSEALRVLEPHSQESVQARRRVEFVQGLHSRAQSESAAKPDRGCALL